MIVWNLLLASVVGFVIRFEEVVLAMLLVIFDMLDDAVDIFSRHWSGVIVQS